MKHFVDHASLRRLALSSLALIIGWNAFTQNIPVGTWRTHFSYNDARHLAVTEDKIFCSTAIGLFSREKSDGSLRRLSKIDGLSDVGVSALAYNQNLNMLVIGYESGYLDFVFEDDLLSISDIAKSNLEGDKSINDMVFGPSMTFLATDLGVIVVNSSDASIIENYVQIGTGGISVEVFEILFRNDSLFIRTTEGIQSGRLDSNLLDFGNWTRYPSTSAYTNLIHIGNEIYSVVGTDLRRLSGGTWIDTGFDLPAGATSLYDVDSQLFTASNGTIYRLEESGFTANLVTSASLVNDITSIGGEMFLADGVQGLINQAGDQLSPSGPISDSFSNFRVIANELYGFHAPSPFSYNGSAQIEGYSKFSEGKWEAVSIPIFNNVSDVARYNGNFYFSSIGDGIYDELNNTTIKNIPASSSQLDTIITALASGERLWASSFRNDNSMHIMDESLEWTSYASTFLNEDEYLTIDLSETGIGWLGASSGIITVLDPEEIQVDQISTSDGLPSSFIDIDISVEDNAWVATTRGPAFFSDASFIFSDSEGIQPTFENRILFDNEQINAVMTDGGNRIWFGTNQGLWIFDENTSEQVAVFNEANSPLPSNKIIQLAYNGSNGEVFILTSKGMVSYRSASSIGTRGHRNVTIFPNPVRPDYQGLVALTGLARNASVKVTDINGNLVKTINANGGSASWDLTDADSGKISTGVYLFFSSDSDGEETYVGKIAVVR
ncbi:hypothetical protein [Ekhidna sp.]|uniref:type IX secretion system anionic LPS delivery protein PorZ n=1 Tax=Ekhidna sp. TaxID=2608089 RepID=UPI00329A2AA8